MAGYYTEKLSAEKLRRCYELAPRAVRDYLEAEIQFVRSRIAGSRRVLELGCGYGRVLSRLVEPSRTVCGIDTAVSSLQIAQATPGLLVAAMDAVSLAFPDGAFEAVVCIQNGISAFAVDRQRLVAEAVRVLRPGGAALFSTYAAAFWRQRLAWFEIQAANGLIGEIDYERTANGTITCKDGFRASTVSEEDFRLLAGSVGIEPVVQVVAGSSLFCEMKKLE